MTNAELITALRYCAEHEGCDYYIAKDCPIESTWMCGVACGQILMLDAADALEAAEKRIARLPKWTMLKDEMPKPHTNVLVSGIEAINNSRVYKVMVNDNGTLRPTDYAPSIMWDYWMPFESPNCGARMRKGDK